MQSKSNSSLFISSLNEDSSSGELVIDMSVEEAHKSVILQLVSRQDLSGNSSRLMQLNGSRASQSLSDVDQQINHELSSTSSVAE